MGKLHLPFAPKGTIVLIVALDIFYPVKLTQKDLQDLPAGGRM